jgi:nucleotide-binding universal stress UspA family protein
MIRQITSEFARNWAPDRIGTPRPAVEKTTLLCATDLSARSEHVVKRAAFMANQLDAQLILLHVVAPSRTLDRSVQIRKEVARQLPLTLLPAGGKPKIELRVGDHVATIASVAKETNADLIILGSQQSKSSAPLVGATAEQVTRLARCSALIVNIRPRMRYSAVMFAAEVSDTFVRVARLAASLRLLDAPSVSIVHGFESPYRGALYSAGFDMDASKRNIDEWEKAAEARLLLSLDAAGVESDSFQLFFQQSRPLRAIQRVIRRVKPDLLIIGTKDRSALNRIVRGSAANDVLRTFECDILVAAPGAEAIGSIGSDQNHASVGQAAMRPAKTIGSRPMEIT